MEIEELVAPPKLILASPNGKGKVVVLSRNSMSIGRDPGNDLVLDSTLVSRRHAMLLTDGPFITLRDLGSRNGTHVNGRRIEAAVLADRDVIEIGDCLLRFLAFDQEAVPADAMSAMVERGQLYQRRNPNSPP